MNKEEDEGQSKLTPVDISTGEIELPRVDVTPYIGEKTKIVSADTLKGEYGYLVRFQTAVVETVRGGKKDIELRGSRIFGLQEDVDGHVGWGADTKLGKFLKANKAQALKDMIGKEVILQSQTSKTGTKFLTFD